MRKDTISVRLLQEALLGFTRSGQSAEALLAELGFAQLPLHQPDERISV
ncbi:MAG: AraC family transcriptional regulator, partial [Pseudomonas formosensis]|nr:AraC family transcriptional regulator [Halopseudomonas formosensis]